MKKFLLSVLALIVLAVAGLMFYASTKPDSFRIERSVTIGAPAAKVYQFIEDFRLWETWSPFFDKDKPDTKITYSGPAKGVGALCTWSGKNLGQGSREITEAKPNELVKMKLAFTAPMKSEFTSEFILNAEGNKTKVTWANYGPSSYMTKVFQVLMNMDKMMGDEQEARLGSLKTVVEAAVAPEKKK